jgi:hypothetical protein
MKDLIDKATKIENELTRQREKEKIRDIFITRPDLSTIIEIESSNKKDNLSLEAMEHIIAIVYKESLAQDKYDGVNKLLDNDYLANLALNDLYKNRLKDVDEDTIKQLRGESRSSVPSYSEEDEVDFYEKPAPRKKIIREEQVSSVNVDENYLRKLIASELTKALPKVIEHYFDSRLVKENVQFKAGSTIFSGTVMPMPKVKGKNNI